MKELLKVGNIIKGKVSGIENYGVFLHLDNGYNGLIHISEVAEGYVKDIKNYVNVGDIIYCQILDVDYYNKKVKLSIKNINYRTVIGKNELHETRLGFLPLKEHLNEWIEEKLKIYKSGE